MVNYYWYLVKIARKEFGFPDNEFPILMEDVNGSVQWYTMFELVYRCRNASNDLFKELSNMNGSNDNSDNSLVNSLSSTKGGAAVAKLSKVSVKSNGFDSKNKKITTSIDSPGGIGGVGSPKDSY